MQCIYCKGQDLVKLSYDYYECKTCGKLNYVDKQLGKKSIATGELYFTLGVGSVVLIITILILLFFTAAGKRESVQTSPESSIVTEVKK